MRGCCHRVLSFMWATLDVGFCRVKLKPIELVFLLASLVRRATGTVERKDPN